MLLSLFLFIQISLIYPATCTKVLDGDTIKLSNGITVRFQGIDTPETKHPSKPIQYYGEEATQFVKERIEGKKIKLEYDKVNKASKHKDKYGRTLAYVWYKPEKGKKLVNLNKELVSKGYAFCYTKYGPFKYIKEFRHTQQMAIENKRGMWKLLVHDIMALHFMKLYADLGEDERGTVLIYMKGLLEK